MTWQICSIVARTQPRAAHQWRKSRYLAIAGVHDSVDERLALVQDAIDQVPDIGQVKDAVSEEVSDVVQVQLTVTVQREIVHAIGDEVKRTVQQQVSEVVRWEVKSVV